MSSTESKSRNWFVEKLWVLPALALLLPLVAYVLMFSKLVSASLVLSLLLTVVVGIVVLLTVLVLRITGVADLKEGRPRLAMFLALADVVIAGLFVILLFLAAPR